MAETSKLLTYLGYAKLEPTNSDDLAWIVFPLNKPARLTIGTSPTCNLFLPPSEGFIPEAVLYVDENGKVSIENTSQPNIATYTCETMKVGGSLLPMDEKCDLTKKISVDFGPYAYTFDFTDPPTVRYLRNLFDAVQCGLCSKLLDEPRSLACSHMFCLSCVNKLVEEATNRGISPNAPSTSPWILCPICAKRTTVQEVNAATNFKALSEVTKTIRQLNAQRAMCQMCSNKRCIMHGSDYTFCETCQVVLCPICAMDGHRKHLLRSNYVKALRAGQAFARKCFDVKQQWTDLMRNVESTESKVQNALKAIEKCIDKITKMEENVEEKVKCTNQLYLEIEKLQTMRWSDKVDAKRTELLNSFEKTLKLNSRTVNMRLSDLKATANALINAKSTTQLLQQQKSVSVGTLTPLSSAMSPPSSPRSHTGFGPNREQPSLNSASSPESSPSSTSSSNS